MTDTTIESTVSSTTNENMVTPNAVDQSEAVPTQIAPSELQSILDNYDASTPSVDGYTPVFNDTVRTVIYVVCFIIGLIGGILTVVAALAGAPVWVTVTAAIFAWVAPQIANAFGVAYNPLKLASK